MLDEIPQYDTFPEALYYYMNSPVGMLLYALVKSNMILAFSLLTINVLAQLRNGVACEYGIKEDDYAYFHRKDK